MENCSIEQIYRLWKKSAGVCTDSRKVVERSIFFALQGESFNGNAYARDAINKGSAFAVIDEKRFSSGSRYILVKNVLETLQLLARFHRQQLSIPVIAITGTNGKTTTKELVSSVLSQKFNVAFTKGNLNNHIGVPLTLLSISKKDQIAIIEMGANHCNEINKLCEIAKPDAGIITNIGYAHLEGFGGLRGVIRAKNELYQYLFLNHGLAFVNIDDNRLMRLAEGIYKVTYGTKSYADCIGKYRGSTPYFGFNWRLKKFRQVMRVNKPVKTFLTGKYNFYNALAAACIGNYYGVEMTAINNAISAYKPKNNRSQFVTTKRGNKLLLDAYNANPSNMKASLENFSEIASSPRMIILGDMLELGKFSAREHGKIAKTVGKMNFERVVLIGKKFSEVKSMISCIHFHDVDEAKKWVAHQNISGYSVFLKGSRKMQIEDIAEQF